MNRGKELAKNSLILSIGTLFPKLVNIIILPVITGHLTKIEYGTYDLVSTLVSLLLPFVTLQIQSAAFRFLIDCRENETERKRVISNIYIFIVPVSLITLSVLYFALYKLEPMTRVLISLYFFFDIIMEATRQIVRGLSKNKLYSFSTAIEAVCKVILIVLIVGVMDRGLHGVLLTFIVSTVVGIVLLFIGGHIGNNIDLRLGSWSAIRQMLAYSWPLVPNSLSNWVLKASDRLVLTSFMGLEAVAIYGAANKIPQIFTLLHGTFAFAWQENASLALKDDNVDEYYTQIFDTIFSLLTGSLAVIMGMTPLLFYLLIRGDYGEAYVQMPILFLGLFFSAIASFVGGIYVAHKKTRIVGITTMLAALCNLLIDLALVKTIGIYAASISTLVSYLLLTIYRVSGLRKFQRISFKYRKIVLCFSILVGMCLLCWYNKLPTNIINMLLGCVFCFLLNRSVIKTAVASVSARLKKAAGR